MNRLKPMIGSWALWTKSLSYLPLPVEIKHEAGDNVVSERCVLDYLRDDEIPAAYRLLTLAAERGDNVGLDEFPGESDFQKLLRVSTAFSVRTAEGRPGATSLLCVAVLSPCRLSRGLMPRLAEILVFVSRDLSGDAGIVSALNTVVPVCEKIAIDMDIGYTACVVQVAVVNVTWHAQLRQLGYHVAACLPKCVLMQGHGLFSCLVMYKVIADLPSKDWTAEELITLPKVVNDSMTKEDYDASGYICRQIPFLPLELTYETRNVVIRNLRKGEESAVFDLFVGAVEEGLGYSKEEFPSLEYFCQHWLRPNYALLIQEEETDIFAGFILIRPIIFVRSHSTPTCTFTGVASPSFRGGMKGTGLTTRVAEMVAYQLGYRYLLSSLLSFQRSAIRICNDNDYYMTGALPHGIKIQNRGWIDMLFVSREIRPTVTTEEIQRHKL